MVSQNVSISQFFENRSVFITGATGFMGKVLIEKLLRSCPKIGAIYILMRSKKNKDLNERLKDLTDSVVYNRLKKERPNALEKVIPVGGDVMELNLGLSSEDKKMLEQNVTVIFHVAASVRFDDPLKDALIMNTRGTREVIKLASNIPNLAALVHVSTTYCNTDKKEIYEKVYPTHTDWQKSIEIAENLQDEYALNILTSKIMGNYPNTYTFTKSLAEHCVFDMCNKKIPAIIFRPSIVIATLKEPIKGWMDNFNGPVGIFIATGKGLMRTIHTDPNLVADYMPVDVAIKAMIIAAWKKGTESNKEVAVYNCSSAGIRQVTMTDLIDIALKLTYETPLNNVIWCPNGAVTKYKRWHYINVILFHVIPAILIDSFLRLSGNKPRLFKLQRKIYIANEALSYFTTNNWVFHNSNFQGLQEDILDCDLREWDFNFKNEDVNEYFKHCITGGRKYLLNESKESLPKAIVHYRRMYWIDKMVKVVFLFLFIYYIYNSGILQSICNRSRRVTYSLFNLRNI